MIINNSTICQIALFVMSHLLIISESITMIAYIAIQNSFDFEVSNLFGEQYVTIKNQKLLDIQQFKGNAEYKRNGSYPHISMQFRKIDIEESHFFEVQTKYHKQSVTVGRSTSKIQVNIHVSLIPNSIQNLSTIIPCIHVYSQPHAPIEKCVPCLLKSNQNSLYILEEQPYHMREILKQCLQESNFTGNVENIDGKASHSKKSWVTKLAVQILGIGVIATYLYYQLGHNKNKSDI